MAEQTEMHDPMANMEEQMKQFFVAMRQMSAQIEFLWVNPILVSAPPEIAASEQMNKIDEDDMLELEDDPPQVTIKKAKFDSLPKT